MDELERRLQRVLKDDRWRLDADHEDTLDRVHAGAARRQRQQRARTGGLSALAVIVVVAAGITVVPKLTQQGATSDGSAGAASPARTSESPLLKRVDPSPTNSGRVASPGGDDDRRTARANPSGAAVPAGFRAVSVTATGLSTYYVLGTAPCTSAPCTSIVRTTDQGNSFRGIPAPKAELARTGSADAASVSDLRFASKHDAYAFGGALWSTHDGGGSWRRQDVGGEVVRLEAAQGTAWALVDTGSRFRLYRSSVGTDTWSRVGLPVALDGATPDLALDGNRVVVIGGSGSRAVTLTSATGARFRDHGRPCSPDLGGNVSASGGGLWMFCATGPQGAPYVSRNGGASWQRVAAAPAGGWPNSAVVGARSEGFASIAAGGRIYRVSSGGGVDAAGTPGAGTGAFRYVGFTSTSSGFVVRDKPSTGALWHTSDGGVSWRTVAFS